MASQHTCKSRGAREAVWSRARPYAPAACSRRNHGGPTNRRQHTRAPHGTRPKTASEHEPERYGGHAPHGQSDVQNTRFVACPGKAEGRTEARPPPAPLTPRPHRPGERQTGHPPPKTHPPALERPRRAGPPHGEHTAPSQVGGKRDWAAPPQKQTKRSMGPGQEARRGTDRVERPYQCPRPGPREVRAPHQPGEGGGGVDAAGARAHTHTKDTGGIPEGEPDGARGTHRPHGMAYQRARARDTRTGRPATHSTGQAGREEGNGEDTTPGTGPSPPNRPRALRPPRQ